MGGDLHLDVLQDEVRGAYGDVDAQLLEDGLVLGVVESGYGAGHVEHLLGHLADDEVVLVVPGDGNYHIRTGRPGLLQVLGLAGVPPYGYAPQLLGDLRALLGILLYYQHLMALGKELLGQVIAHLSSTSYNYIHGFLRPLYGVLHELSPHVGGADGLEPQGTVELLAKGVVNAAYHLGHVKDVLGDLGRHYIAVVPLGHGGKGVGLLDPGAPQHIGVDAVPHHGRAVEAGG